MILASALCFYVDLIPSLVATILLTLWIVFGQPALLYQTELTSSALQEGLSIVVITGVVFIAALMGSGEGMFDNLNLEGSAEDNLLLEKISEHMNGSLLIVDESAKEVKFHTKSFEKYGEISTLLTQQSFTPLSITMDALLERTEASSSELLKKIKPDKDQDKVPLFSIIQSKQHSQSEVYAVEKPEKANQIEELADKSKHYIAIKVVDIVFNGEKCKAVYFYDMQHQVDAVTFQMDHRRRQSSYQSYLVMNHELHDTLASSIMLLSQVLVQVKEEKILLFLRVVQSQLYFTLNFINDINDLKNLTIRNFDNKMKDFDPIPAFKFIIDIFSCQSQINKNQFSFHAVSPSFIKMARDMSLAQLGEI